MMCYDEENPRETTINFIEKGKHWSTIEKLEKLMEVIKIGNQK